MHQNTVVSVMSGLAIRYHNSLSAEAKRWEQLAKNARDPGAIAGAYRTFDALHAEAPISFSLEPSNMAVSVKVNKVNPHGGELIEGSDIQVGLVGGLAGEGNPTTPFSDEDLQIAVERLREQKQVGLIYGLPSGSGFLKDY